MNFYFVRHGQSEANAAGIVADSTSKLTQKGIDQAIRTGFELKSEGISVILSSPYVRAKQTAELIAEQLGISSNHIKIVEEIRERGLGECETKPKDMESEKFFSIDADRGFESHADIITRMKKVLRIVEEESARTNGNVLIVGHAVSGFFLRQVSIGKDKFSEFNVVDEQSNAAVIKVSIK